MKKPQVVYLTCGFLLTFDCNGFFYFGGVTFDCNGFFYFGGMTFHCNRFCFFSILYLVHTKEKQQNLARKSKISEVDSAESNIHVTNMQDQKKYHKIARQYLEN